MSSLRQAIDRVAPTNSRVLIVGPSGAGKELAARTMHQLSARASGPFIVINAAAITPERMETELFGVEANGAELEIVLQGDQPARVTELLTARGFRVGGVTR